MVFMCLKAVAHFVFTFPVQYPSQAPSRSHRKISICHPLYLDSSHLDLNKEMMLIWSILSLTLPAVIAETGHGNRESVAELRDFAAPLSRIKEHHALPGN